MIKQRMAIISNEIGAARWCWNKLGAWRKRRMTLFQRLSIYKRRMRKLPVILLNATRIGIQLSDI